MWCNARLRMPAAAAVNSLAARLAAGADRLAELVRKDEDLNAGGLALDEQAVTALSQDAASRSRSEEQRMSRIVSPSRCRTKDTPGDTRKRVSGLCGAVDPRVTDHERYSTIAVAR